MSKLTPKQAAKLGKKLRNAKDGNWLVGSFASELAGQDYPFSKAMCDIVFNAWDDEQLGYRF